MGQDLVDLRNCVGQPRSEKPDLGGQNGGKKIRPDLLAGSGLLLGIFSPEHECLVKTQTLQQCQPGIFSMRALGQLELFGCRFQVGFALGQFLRTGTQGFRQARPARETGKRKSGFTRPGSAPAESWARSALRSAA